MINTTAGLPGIVQSIAAIFNMVIPVLVALAMVLFFIGIIRYIYAEGEHEKRDLMLWSLITLFVLFSLWGILRLMCGTLTQSSSCAANTNYNANTGLYNKSGPSADGGIYPI